MTGSGSTAPRLVACSAQRQRSPSHTDCVAMVVYVTAADADEVAAADDVRLCQMLTGPGAWELDRMWWVAVSLLTPGCGLIDGVPLTDALDDTQVLCLAHDSVATKVDAVSDLDRDELL